MKANINEGQTFHSESLLADCSSEEEPGGKVKPDTTSVKILSRTVSSRSSEFIRRHFPLTEIDSWNDWKWQTRNSISSLEALSKIIELTDDEIKALSNLGTRLPLKITPYFASLIYDKKPGHALRANVIPVLSELINDDTEKSDPLDEMKYSPVRGIIHRYPDRVLFTVTQLCNTYCRYCTRSHSVSQLDHIRRSEWEKAFEYIEAHTEVRDVIVSGGDPLTLSNESLDYLLGKLRAIKHVQIIRIGTRMPVANPMRITPRLVNILKKYHPLFMSLHFSHPEEMTPETVEACNMLADGGIPLGSQTVLLKGINDSVEVMKELMHKLLMARVRPYYLYQCDLIPGSSHFRTPISKGLEIIKGLRGFTSGYAIPQFVIDAPGGGGKIPLLPNYVVEHTDEKIVLRNYKGDHYEYPETDSDV